MLIPNCIASRDLSIFGLLSYIFPPSWNIFDLFTFRFHFIIPWSLFLSNSLLFFLTMTVTNVHSCKNRYSSNKALFLQQKTSILLIPADLVPEDAEYGTMW